MTPRHRRSSWLRLAAFVHVSLFEILLLPAPASSAPGDAPPFDATVVDNTGAAHASVPIELPPGSGGLVPPLALTYSSDAGDGFLGVGWRLPLGEVRCSARFGVPDYTACPVYELDGELLMGPDASGAYHTFVESFRRIRKVPFGSAGEFAWEVTERDGTRFLYGGASDARIDGPALSPAIGAATARWLLSEVRDVSDNRVTVTWDDLGDAGSRYPATLAYAGGARVVAFFYEARPDPRHDFVGGIEQVARWRLREIQVTSNGAVHQRVLLDYSQEGDYPTHRTRLVAVTRFGADCPPHPAPLSGCSSLPAQRFAYTEPFETAYVDADGPTNWAPDPERFANTPSGVEFGDVNGDGLLDAIAAWCISPVQHWPCAAPASSYGDPGVGAAVFLNTGSGWEATPSEPWSAALGSLVWDAPTLRIKTTGDDYSLHCAIEEGSYPSGVFFNTRGEIDGDLDVNFLSAEVEGGSWVVEVGVDTSWRIVDLDGDGRAELVASTRVGGVWQKLNDDCFGALDPDAYHEAHTRVVFRNTGSGWERAPALETEIPAFSVMEISDSWGGYCDNNGWFGRDDDFDRPNICRQMMEYPAIFLDLNGDGRLDLLATRPVDLRYLPFNGGDLTVSACGEGLSTPGAYDTCLNPVGTYAWIQVRDSAGEYTWQPAPEFDLVDPAGGLLHLVHLDFIPYPTVYEQDNPEFTAFISWDDGVRIADLNGDGLPDVTWRDPIAEAGEVHHGGPGAPVGALLNTGSGWCPVLPGAPCGGDPETGRLLPPVSLAGVASRNAESGSIFDIFQIGGTYDYADVNGDGLPELFRSGGSPGPDSEHNYPLPENWDGGGYAGSWPGSEDFSGSPGYIEIVESLHSPGSDGVDGSPWIDAAGGVYADGGFMKYDLDGDGIADYPSYGANPAKLSILAHPDLLRRIDNGRGGTIEFTYEAEAEQRDAGLEAVAEANAPDAPGVARFTSRPVVASITVDGPNRAPATTTYAYARGRWCPEYRSGLGFGMVRTTRPDGSFVDAHYYQRHGAAGRLAERTVYEEVAGQTRARHHTEETWEIVATADLPPGAWAGDGSGAIAGGPVRLGRLVSRSRANEYGAAPGDDSGAVVTESFSYDDVYGFGFVSGVETLRATTALRTTRVPLPLDGALLDAWIIGLPEEVRTEAVDPDVLLGRTVLDYDARGRVVRATADVHPRGNPASLETLVSRVDYDARGNVMRRVDPAGRATELCYDGNPGNLDWCDAPEGTGSVLVGVRDAAGSVTVMLPDPVFGTGLVVDPAYTDQPATRVELDAFGREAARFVTPEGGDEIQLSSTIHHDETAPPWRERWRTVDETSGETIHTASVGDGFGGVWKEIEEVDPATAGGPLRHRCTARYHDAPGRVLRETYPLPSDALCSGVTGSAEQPATEVETDALGRSIRTSTPDGVSVVRYGVDVLPVLAASGAVGSASLDTALAKDAKGGLALRALEGERVLVVEECENTATPQTLDLAGMPCSGSDHRTLYAYQASGELETALDPLGNALRYHYDTLGRIVRVDDPDAGTSHSAYDAAGNLAWTRDARGMERAFEYDALDRPTRIVTPPGEPDVTIHHRSGELSSSGESAGGYATILAYDALGRLRVKKADNDGVRTSARREYDLLGRLTSIRYGNGLGAGIRYEYEGAYLKRVCRSDHACGMPGETQYVEDVVYDELGRRSRMVLPGGVRDFAYQAPSDPADDARRLVSDAFAGAGPDGFVTAYTFAEYDPLGNVLSWDVSSAAEGLSATGVYTYDERNRLSSWTRDGATETFAYDAVGNLTLHGGEPQHFGAGAAGPHAITSRGGSKQYAYDASGHLASVSEVGAADRHFAFDSGGRLACVGTASGACDLLSVSYDAAGRRVREVAGGRTRRFYDDTFVETRDAATDDAVYQIGILAFGELVATTELSQPGWVHGTAPVLFGAEVSPRWLAVPPVVAFAWLLGLALRGGLLLGVARRPGAAGITTVLVLAIALPPSAVRAGGGGYYEFHRWILSDALGSGVVVLDEAGMLMRHTRFRPFGGVDDERAPGDRSGRRIWAGHPEQEETGLVQMQARWMDPETGTFLSVDPVVPDARDPQAFNAYAYAANNPVSLADPSGMSPPAPGPPGGLNAFYAEPGQSFAGGGGMLQSASEVHAYQQWGEAESEPGSDLVPLAGTEQGGGSWLRGLGELLDLVWTGVRAVVKLIANDVIGAVFGFGYGNLMGLLGGFGTALGGLLTGDVSQLRSGIRSMGWALVPRFGFNSGPGHSHPELEPRTVIDEATLEHDTAYARLNEEERVGILSRRTTAADARLIRSVWRSPLHLGPVGQVYRAGLTVSFAFKIGAQEALGATGVIE